MSLLTYEQARPYARAIANEVTNRTMPPWHADAPAGTFHNERSSADAERQTLTAWAAAARCRAMRRICRLRPRSPKDGRSASPMSCSKCRRTIRIPARGAIEYEYFYIPTNFTEAKWVKSIEIRPGNREAVHHVLVYYGRSPTSRARRWRSRRTRKTPMTPRTTRAATSIRAEPHRRTCRETPRHLRARHQSAGRAGRHRVPARAGRHLELQMHYTTNGKAATDRTKIGMMFVERTVAARECAPTHFFNGTLDAAGRRG